MKIDIREYVTKEKAKLSSIRRPSLLILQVGDDSASNAYIKGKLKDAKELGIRANLFKATDFYDLHEFLSKMGSNYTGIILQEPSGLSEEERKIILNQISDIQDVDGFKVTSRHKPCTPAGIMNILKNFYGDIGGKVITVVGKGALVGMPLVPMLMEKGATVLSCNSKTSYLGDYTKTSDIVITATGVSKLITRDMLKDGAFVIDAGIAFDEDGKMCGDCDKAIYDDESINITTVPGGVGLMTRLQLMKNIFAALEMR